MDSSHPQTEHVGTTPLAGGRRGRISGLRAAGRRAVDPLALGLLAVLVVLWWVTLALQGSPGDWAFDFRQFWQGASDAVHGVSPYPTASLLATASAHLDPEGIREVFRFPYPAGALVVLAPLGFLGFHAAAAVWSALLIVSLAVALMLLGVRDWRVYGVVATSAPVLSSVRLGTFTPVLVLLLAAMWRWRDRRWMSGGSLGLAVSLKLFLWPAALWLLATRRFAAAAIAAAFALLLTLGAWAAIGFAGLSGYSAELNRLTEIVAARGYSLVALGVGFGLPRGMADLLPWIVGLALLGLCVANARRGRERSAFALVVIAALALTPIDWLHSFALLVVPLALLRPRFGWPWILLCVFWLTPIQENAGDLWRVLVGCAVAGAVIVVAARDNADYVRSARSERV